MVDAMEAAGAEGRAQEKGVELAAQVVASMKRLCQGVHIMAIGLEAEVPQILELAGVRAGSARQAVHA